jgi:hypothetical protein
VADLRLVRPMTRTINVTVGVLLFAAGIFVAFVSYAVLSDSLLRIFTSRWWTYAVLLWGSVLALAALGLLRWRRRSALAASVSAVVLAALYFPTSRFTEADYTWSAIFLGLVVLAYWRFLHSDARRTIHTQA